MLFTIIGVFLAAFLLCRLGIVVVGTRYLLLGLVLKVFSWILLLCGEWLAWFEYRRMGKMETWEAVVASLLVSVFILPPLFDCLRMILNKKSE